MELISLESSLCAWCLCLLLLLTALKAALVELIDMMPTIGDLAGLPPPLVHQGEAPLDGISLAPLFQEHPPMQLKSHVLAQYPRCPVDQNTSNGMLWHRNLCINTPAAQFGWMGALVPYLRAGKLRVSRGSFQCAL